MKLDWNKQRVCHGINIHLAIEIAGMLLLFALVACGGD